MHVIMSVPEDRMCFCHACRKLTAMATDTAPIRTSQLCCFHAIQYVLGKKLNT